ncbi:MAG: hypothetical protein E7012_05855 [Alphaproteobacteria bacterium]|nr:hypothetical protein [Alphaproteobacteria bacterium]
MIIRLVILIILGTLSYLLGRSHSQIKVITEQIEVIKYVEQQKSKIHSRPNATRSELLKLMQNNML